MDDEKWIQPLLDMIRAYNHEDCVFHTINDTMRDRIIAWGRQIRREAKIETLHNLRGKVTSDTAI